MASNVPGSETPVHFTLLSDDVLPNKHNENKLITTTAEPSKANEVGEDDVFANENETARAAPNSIFLKESERVLDHDQYSSTVVVNQVSDSSNSIISTTVSPESSVIGSIVTTTVVTATSNNVIIPVSTTATTRRPSYTSKAPSALTNLPKIDDISTSSSINNIQSFVTLHTTSLLEKRSSTSGFDHDENNHHIRSTANKDLLGLHAQASFESIDEYSNPGTPTSNSSPAAGQTSSRKYREKSRMRADVLSKDKLEMAARSNVLTVRCREQVAELHKYKFGSGSKGKCIKVRITFE